MIRMQKRDSLILEAQLQLQPGRKVGQPPLPSREDAKPFRLSQIHK
jgi:hypothetical protein